MKKTVLYILLSVGLTPAFGQNRVVEVDNLGANYAATPPTVTFRVYWDAAPTPPRHRDTVWLFVDVQPINPDNSVGAWAPATVAASPAPTTTDGTLFYPVALPYRGFYIDGDETGAFSATVTVALDGLTPGAKFNWCAYATDYPPNAVIGAGAYNLHGTPPFVVDNQTLGAGVRTYADCIDTLTDATGCPGLIPAQPDITAFTASTTTICLGDSVTLTATATAAASYSFDGGTTWDAATGQGATARVAPTATTTYTLAARNDAGCSVTYSPAITVTVNPLPTIGVTATPNTICSGDTSIITITSDLATQYSFNGGLAWTAASTFSTGTLTAAATDTTYYVAVKTDAGCSATGDVTIRINPLPIPAFVNPPSTYCGDSTVTLTASGGGPGGEYCFTYAYDGASHNPYLTGNDEPAGVDCGFAEIVCTFGADSVRAFTMPESGSLTVWVKVRNAHGCVDSTSATIAVKPQPVISLTGPQSATTQSVLIEQQIAAIPYTTTDALSVAVEGLPAGMTYTWASPTVTIEGASTVIGEHPYTVTATGICGTTTAQGTITVAGSRFSMTSTATDSIYFNVSFSGGLALHIDWGDGTSDTYTGNGGKKHFFAGGGPPYTVTGQARIITRLDCYSNKLTALDVTGCAALISLNCFTNQLTALDVSKNTALTDLNCASNQLAALDVSKNTALTSLSCYTNKLSGTLDLSYNTGLLNLACSGNQLTALNVTRNTKLTSLQCSNNSLSTLNLTQNIALTELYCSGNQLTALDVSKNTALITLQCHNNQLTALDISKNTALTSLNCGSNQLTALEVTPHLALTTLQCGDNLLTDLNVSNNTKLTILESGYNPLTTLDISHNTKLTTLNCTNNQLSTLDITPQLVLTTLRCGNNQLSELDLSANTLLRTLDCSYIGLTTLNLSANPALTFLNCVNNQLTALDLSANPALDSVWCYGNQLTALDVTANTALKRLRIQTNQFTAAALNALFNTLPTGGSGKKIYIYNNPRSNPGAGSGTSGCDRSLAEGWGWEVNDTITTNQNN